MFGTAHTEWEVAEHQTRMKNREPRSHTEIAKYSSDITIVQEEICAWTGGDKMATVPRTAVVAGERLPVTVLIDNDSKGTVNRLRVALQQMTIYTGDRTNCTYSNCSSIHRLQKTKKNILTKAKKIIKVGSKSQGSEEMEITIPFVPTTFRCPIICFEYGLSIKVKTNSLFESTLRCHVPNTIGTIEMKNSDSAHGHANENAEPSSSKPLI
uniref:Arrestin_N domain-containing protein n=2 Tax=Caenorhabditis tropicalis TaxID=1561998 RepID=A0A1I7TRM4_9PELO